MKPLVPIIMGSKSDLSHGEAIATALAGYGIDSEIRVASAHKAATYLLDLLAGGVSRNDGRYARLLDQRPA